MGDTAKPQRQQCLKVSVPWPAASVEQAGKPLFAEVVAMPWKQRWPSGHSHTEWSTSSVPSSLLQGFLQQSMVLGKQSCIFWGAVQAALQANTDEGRSLDAMRKSKDSLKYRESMSFWRISKNDKAEKFHTCTNQRSLKEYVRASRESFS